MSFAVSMHKNSKKIWFRYILSPLILLVLLYLIYLQINAKGDFIGQWQQLKANWNANSFWWFGLVFLFALTNWALEARKWQFLLQRIRPIDFTTAFKSMLSGMSISIITPNRSGDFIGRIVHIPKGYKLKAAISSMIGSVAQMCIAAICGFMGLVYYHFNYSNLTTQIGLVLAMIFLPIAIFLFLNIHYLKPFKKKNLWLRRLNFGIYILRNYNRKDLLKIMLLSLGRVIIFNLQFLLLLYISGVSLPFIPGLLVSFLMFWVIAMVPSIAITDLAVRGYIGVALFMSLGVIDSGLPVLSASYLLWLINLALPAIVGSFMFLRIKM